jgi:hypothetical protein
LTHKQRFFRFAALALLYRRKKRINYTYLQLFLHFLSGTVRSTVAESFSIFEDSRRVHQLFQGTELPIPLLRY